MTLVIKSGNAAAFAEWQAHFATFAPQLEIRAWTDPRLVAEQVLYAMVWEPEPGRLARFPNLRLISSAGAGVDQILSDPQLPPHVPVVRVTTDDTARRMAEYVCWAALSLMRRAPEIIAAQRSGGFDSTLTGQTAPDTRVGVMGLGAMGAKSAELLVALGFQVAGWSARPKNLAGVESFAGDAALAPFLARSDILVCLLPLTPDTTGIIRAETLALLPKGAGVINAGRGGHVVEADLLAALDAGHVAGAVLDVFDPEPLAADHPLRAHPRVLVTPHVASFGSRKVRARHVAGVIAAFERGEALAGLYDPVRGY